MSVAAVTPAMARALIDYVQERNYKEGVIGVRASQLGDMKPQHFEHAGKPVAMVPCGSALAARSALIEERQANGWLVLVTDRSEEDLGAGLLAHIIGQRLRLPDAWQAVQYQFAATAVDAQLIGGPGNRELAAGLLEATPPDGWSPAPAGVLTRDHALLSVARNWLDLPEGDVDLVVLLEWSSGTEVAPRIGTLRRLHGDALADAVLAHLASRAGAAEPLVRQLTARGTITDLVPLGLALDALLGSERSGVDVAVARLEHRWGQVSRAALAAAGRGAAALLAEMLADERRRGLADSLLDRAEAVVREAQAAPLMDASDLLRSGLDARLRRLAEALERHQPSALDDVETLWRQVRCHRLHDRDGRVPALHAAVRLRRWLASDANLPTSQSLPALARRQADVDAWVDAAFNDVAEGVGDHLLAEALEKVTARVFEVRNRHDGEFASALLTATEKPHNERRLGEADHVVWPLEHLVEGVVIPIAKLAPTLLLVLDGMSTGVATELVDDILSRNEVGMAEVLLPGQARRAAGLALLPTITEVSRASLLCGKLVTGGQNIERKGYAEMTNAAGLGDSPLFHKKVLDTSRPGFAVADEVRTALLDPTNRLVTCILNTIDDALDRSDPSGTVWTAEAVKHLVPLLQQAGEAGRSVVLTADHGHIVERRQGELRTHPGASSARYRSVSGDVATDEVLVRGPRVLTPSGEVVLAVSERLRYTGIMAGYHGGAAPAEAVVPVVALVPTASVTDETRLAPPQAPAWWEGVPTLETGTPETVSTVIEQQPDLFGSDEPGEVWRPGTEVVKSKIYAQQQKLAGRVVVDKGQVAGLIDALVVAGGRLSATQVANVLETSVTRVQFRLGQVAKQVNVEGYPVLSTDPATGAAVLDEQLMGEQYGIAR